MRLENLTVDDLAALLLDVQRRSHVAVAAVVAVAGVVAAEAGPAAGFVAVLAVSGAVFALSKSALLPHLQPLPSACRAFGLNDDDAARVGAHVDVPLLFGVERQARALKKALRA